MRRITYLLISVFGKIEADGGFDIVAEIFGYSGGSFSRVHRPIAKKKTPSTVYYPTILLPTSIMLCSTVY
jgi:hypothetical protein